MAQAGKGRLNYRCPSCFMVSRYPYLFFYFDFTSGNSITPIRVSFPFSLSLMGVAYQNEVRRLFHFQCMARNCG